MAAKNLHKAKANKNDEFYTQLDQFEILGLSQKVGFGLESIKFYDDFEEIRKDGSKTGSSGKKTNGNPVMKGMSKTGNYFTNGSDIVHSLYSRIFIKNMKI